MKGILIHSVTANSVSSANKLKQLCDCEGHVAFSMESISDLQGLEGSLIDPFETSESPTRFLQQTGETKADVGDVDLLQVEEESFFAFSGGAKLNSSFSSDEGMFTAPLEDVIPQALPVAASDEISLEDSSNFDDLLVVRRNPVNIVSGPTPPSSSRGRGTKRKKYMEDPSTDSSGKVKNAIAAKRNRDRKKLELIQEKQKHGELLIKYDLLRQERDRERHEREFQTARADKAEKELAQQTSVFGALYSEICTLMPEYGKEIQKQLNM